MVVQIAKNRNSGRRFLRFFLIFWRFSVSMVLI